jgi:long-chain acyl-CoA synthetase
MGEGESVSSVPRTVPGLIGQSVERFGDRPAFFHKVEDAWQPISYRDLDQRAKAFASGLIHRLGVEKGDLLAMIANNRPEWMVASLGIHFAGAVDVPRGSDTPPEILQTILRHSGARMAILEDLSVLEKLGSVASQLETLVLIDPPDGPLPANAYAFKDLLADGERLLRDHQEEMEERLRQLDGEDLASVIYTSGTNGDPRGVMILHRNYLHNPEPLHQLIGLTPEDRLLSILPIWHAYEREVEYTALAGGASIYYGSILQLKDDLSVVRPTIIPSVPDLWVSFYKIFLDRALRGASPLKKALIHFLLNSSRRHASAIRLRQDCEPRFSLVTPVAETSQKVGALLASILWAIPRRLADRLVFSKLRETLGGHLRLALSGAGPLPRVVDEFYDAAGVTILDGYGMTEAMVVIAGRSPLHKVISTSGKALPGIDLRIRGEDHQALPPGQAGEIQLRGSSVSPGYFKNDQLTQERFDGEGWFCTGDLGILTIDGNLRVLGRLDDTLVLRNGEKVNAMLLENELRSDPLVEQAVVVGQGRSYLAAFLFPNKSELQRWAEERGLPKGTLQELAKRPEVIKAYRRLLQHISGNPDRFAPHERVRIFRLQVRDLEVGKELSQSLKLRRGEFERRHAEEIVELYKGEL